MSRHLDWVEIRAGIDSATVDRALSPDCRQACFTVDSDKKLKKPGRNTNFVRNL